MNHYNWGGYFIWKLYPQYRVFMDGRADVYGDALMTEFGDSYYLTDNWRKSLADLGHPDRGSAPGRSADHRPSIRPGLGANLLRFRGRNSHQATTSLPAANQVR